jgi:hypothetical protein
MQILRYMHEMNEESEPTFSADQTKFTNPEKAVNDKNLK